VVRTARALCLEAPARPEFLLDGILPARCKLSIEAPTKAGKSAFIQVHCGTHHRRPVSRLRQAGACLGALLL